MNEVSAPQILCIDDDPDVLEGLTLTLRKLGDVHVANGGAEALALAEQLPALAVVICDMRMPLRNGAEVLSDFRRLHPDATRVLLTGYSDIDDAVAAINNGHIFRFLHKPCDSGPLNEAIGDAIAQHRLVTAEKVLLEQTVRGCVQILVEGLAINSPAAYGQCQRVCTLVKSLVKKGGGMPTWVPEVAIMMSGLGLVPLDASVQEKVLFGKPLDADEQERLIKSQQGVLEMLEKIPRIEQVRDLMRLLESSLLGQMESQPEMIQRLDKLAKLIAMVRQYVRLEATGMRSSEAITQLKRAAEVPEAWLDALGEDVSDDDNSHAVEMRMEVPMSLLLGGMVLVQPIHNANGMLLAPSGHTVSDGFVRRLSELRPDLRHTKIPVIVPAAIVGQVQQALRTLR